MRAGGGRGSFSSWTTNGLSMEGFCTNIPQWSSLDSGLCLMAFSIFLSTWWCSYNTIIIMLVKSKCDTCTLYTQISSLHTLPSTIHSQHCTLNTQYPSCILNTAHHSLHKAHFTLHIAQFRVTTKHLTQHTVQLTLHTSHFTLHTT